MATNTRSAQNTSCPSGLGFSGARGLPSPCEQLRAELFERAGIEVYVKRDDLLGPHVSGNKARKLLHQLPLLKGQGRGATFGGGSSPHLHAFALAGAVEGFGTIGFVWQEANEAESLLVRQARSLGMLIIHLGRDAYRQRHEQRFQDELQERFGPFLLIPEGGTNALGVQGVAEVIQELPDTFDAICCPFGTGGTAIGLLKGLQAAQRSAQLLVFATLRPPGYAEATLKNLAIEHRVRWEGIRVVEAYSFGGYAKVSVDVSMFAANFRRRFGFDLDPIYNAKMAWGLWDLIRQGSFRRSTRILMYHTGAVPDLGLFD